MKLTRNLRCDKMKVLFIGNELGVKQYHLACALADNCNVKPYFLDYDVMNYLPISKKVKLFAKRRLVRYQSKAKQIRRYDPINPFVDIGDLTKDGLEDIDPDVVYISHTVMKIPEYVFNYPFFYDIEDFIWLNRDIAKIRTDSLFKRLRILRKVILRHNLIGVGAGSYKEQEAVKYVLRYKNPILLYPFVAKRTLPRKINPKTENFSVVYAGGVSSGYRDFVPYFKEILGSGLDLTVFMNNSNNYWYYKKVKKLKIYPNFTLYRQEMYSKIKETISEFHVGLTGNFINFRKSGATFGMKPLEYAYANVQPVSLGYPLFNLSDSESFGYVATADKIKELYKDNLKNFDFDYHLMDTHISNFYDVLAGKKVKGESD